jgi:hypothetical protein
MEQQTPSTCKEDPGSSPANEANNIQVRDTSASSYDITSPQASKSFHRITQRSQQRRRTLPLDLGYSASTIATFNAESCDGIRNCRTAVLHRQLAGLRGEVWVANVVVNVRLSLARKNFVIYQKGRSTLYPTVYSKFAVVKALCG